MMNSSRTPSDFVLPDEARQVLAFWFEEIERERWFRSDPAFDATIRERFGLLLERAARVELASFRGDAEGRLAEVLVLDQFSRNVYRGTPRAFAQDPLALALAQEAVAQGAHLELPPRRRGFLLLPYMHSESAVVHVEAERLYRAHGSPEELDYELAHKRIVDRFGRYPHRNAILGRVSTPEEVAFLAEPGSSF